MLRRLVVFMGIFVALLSLAFAWLQGIYRKWLAQQTLRVTKEGHVAQTELGPVQYDMRGSGPVVLHSHGGNVGHNGWFMLEFLVEAGFTVLTPDRPGYLGTPLDDHSTPSAQADVFASLLDHLGVENVAIVGVSAGGPAALSFAVRYPQRTQALVLMSAISKQTQLSDDQLNSTLGKLVMTRRWQDPAYFLIYQAMHHLTALTLQDFVRTETTYDMPTGQRLIQQILADPTQRQQVFALAHAMVPALARYDGVMNDLDVQQTMAELALDQIQAPALIVHSRYDGDVPYANAEYAHQHIPTSQLISVEQFGHMIWWGNPQVTRDFQQQIVQFLKAHIDT
ncbi:MAG: hypothetical protein CL607_09210 [Anaerolineaceae bacterium]|nr:hypothetical protein [Anaerolineaceae bacterium]